MSEPYDAVNELLSNARKLDWAVEQHANSMAELLAGKLRKVHSMSTLRALKKELADYNIHTGRWK